MRAFRNPARFSGKFWLGIAGLWLAALVQGASLVVLNESPAQLELGWDGLGSYQLEVSDDLLHFSTASAITGASIVLSPTNTQRFYRAVAIRNDAGEYVRWAGVTDAPQQSAINYWYAGLEQLGLLEHVKYMATFRAGQTVFSTNVLAMLGPNGQFAGNPSFDSNGLNFSGNESITFSNVLRSTNLAGLTILAVFQDRGNTVETIIGSEGPDQSPILSANGSYHQGVQTGDLCLDYTVDGKTALGDVAGRRTFNNGDTRSMQFGVASFSQSQSFCAANFDHEYTRTPPEIPTLWNDNANWRIGARLENTAFFTGAISFAALLDAGVSEAEYHQIRRLYRKTLGANLPFPEVNLVIEGDSLSEESTGIDYGRHLWNEPHWQGKFAKRNIAHGGDSVATMLAEFETEALPWATELGRNYLFIWGGRNDILARPADEIFNDLHTYWAKARKAGFKTAAFTVIPAAYEASNQLAADRRNELNRLIRDASSEYDFLFDVDQVPELSDPADLRYFLSDGVHLNTDGYTKVADLINRLLPNP